MFMVNLHLKAKKANFLTRVMKSILTRDHSRGVLSALQRLLNIKMDGMVLIYERVRLSSFK